MHRNVLKSTTLLILALIGFQGAFGQKKKITLEDIFLKNTFSVKNVMGFTPLKDEHIYAAIEHVGQSGETKTNISLYEVNSREKMRTLLEMPTQLPNGEAAALHDFQLDPTERKVLLFFNGENIYRRSILYHVYLVDIESQKWIEVSDTKVLHATLSPDGTQIAYVRDNNIFLQDVIEGTTVAVTHDGRRNQIINGNCDWVYEEEFSFTKAYEWSPDGQRLAFYRFDERQVKEYSMTRFNGLYPEQYVYKYPKAGEDNSIVAIKVYELSTGITHNVDLGDETDQYIPRIAWANADELTVLRLNRLQNKLDYLFYNAHQKTTANELTDENPYYVDILDPLVFAQDGALMLFQSERDGYNHVYCLNRNTGKVKQITNGTFDVDQVLGLHPETNEVFYTAGKKNPTHRTLYARSIDKDREYNFTDEEGWVTVTPFPSMQKFLIRSSKQNEVPQFYLMDSDGNRIVTLENNAPLQNKMKEYEWGSLKRVGFKAADQKTDLYGLAIYPPDFEPTKKYPVLMYQYSGPGSQEVRDAFPLGNYWWHQYMAQEGYIVVWVDGRGTGARGQEFKKSTYLQLGKIESDDQIAIAKQLARLEYVDADRIGIWGWSYGGFMSAICILKGNDVFKTAVSVAPVTNWRLYDNIYTERFMRTPAENPEGYDDNSPIDMADRLQGNLLIIHGTADDNVHFQNAVMLTDALIKHGKQFESAYYPDRDHGIRGGNTRYQLFTKITNYLKDNL